MLQQLLLMLHTINRFGRDERGVVYVEYALLITVIALVVITGASLLGTDINGLFNNVAGYIASITTP
jgi:pilus assembly protein Flp/PilA